MKYNKEQKEEAKKWLLGMMKPGDTLYTVLRNVSRSGMSRNIDVYAMVKGEPVWLSGMIARALGMSQAKDESLKVSGCGMDMGFHIVYSVSTFLRNEYKCTGERCPASIHVNEHTPRDGKAMHKDGYAISQRWL